MSESPRPLGRPRSEEARLAVLHAADDLLVEQGYAAMTMKGIAERAGVGRQTVYRWWSSKAEILLEASAADARRELVVDDDGGAEQQVAAFLTALAEFLTATDAGLAYRALLGEAQHDRRVAELLRETDVLGESARTVLGRLPAQGEPPVADDGMLVPELVGPLVFRVLTEGRAPGSTEIAVAAHRFLRR